MKSIVGKWSANCYEVLEKLGSGGVGCVYKVVDKDDKIYAMKVSEDIYSLTREYETLRVFEQYDFVPRVYELDDFSIGNTNYTFFIMEYIQGETLRKYLQKKHVDEKWIVNSWIKLIDYFSKIHELGYFYSDIKPDNIMVCNDGSFKIIDYGSVVSVEKGTKEFTPPYDINSWHTNKKNNKEQRTIFSISLIILFIISRKEFNPMKNGKINLIKEINNAQINKIYKEILIKCINIKYKKIKIFEKELKIVYNSVINNKYIYFRFIDILFVTSISAFLLLLLVIIIK